MKVVALLLILCASVLAQASEPTTAELRKQIAELAAETASTRAEVKALLADNMRRENARLKRRLARQQRLTNIVVDYGKVELKVKELQLTAIDPSNDAKTIAHLIKQRDQLAAKIKRANGRWACEILKIGCVK
jgi:DNA recombination-dependent growth factor C